VSPFSDRSPKARERLLAIEGVPDAALAYLIKSAIDERPLLVVTATLERAEQLAADLLAYGVGGTRLFIGDQHVAYEGVSPDPDLVAARLTLRALVRQGARPPVIVADAASLMSRWLPEAAFAGATSTWSSGAAVDREELVHQLVRCGYQRTTLVEDEGTFAVRGGIIDLFPPTRAEPLRLDLFGDELASIKSFDPATQRTSETLAALTLYPIREVIFDRDAVQRAQARLLELNEVGSVPTRRISQLIAEVGTCNYFFGIEELWPLFYDGSAAVIDTLVTPDTTVVLDKPESIDKTLDERWSRAVAEQQRQEQRREVALPLDTLYLPEEDLRGRQAAQRRLLFAPLTVDEPGAAIWRPEISDWHDLQRELGLRRADATRGEILDPVVAELKTRFGHGQEVFLACGSPGNAERLHELLLARRIDLPVFTSGFPDLQAARSPKQGPRRAIVVSALSGGLVDDERGLAILTDGEIFGSPLRRAKKSKAAPSAEGLTNLRDLVAGDYVIHVDHGVGRYLGLKRIILNGADGDYVHLEYQGGDKLYVPIFRLNLLQRYRGPLAAAKLDKLGGMRWLRAKQRVKDAVLAMAHELLALQAQRHALPGFALPQPDEHFRAFEAAFAFEETPDQQRAIDEVLGDLVKDTPMDRLVCGDVGFGKTEVAVRAAFLAVLGKKQVAVLVPTTVLAEQHGMTFRDRLGPQGITVEVLSRFRGPKEVQGILSRLRMGGVDVLIGTHRMLSTDVVFKGLGLLVIDEEHRFGVKHKERIKQLRAHVHVLTLSATPIPRTMHMAMTGLRDLSLIQTPPVDRTAIRTEVTRFDEGLIAEAIRRELHRGGQVFVVHNRIRSIGAMAELVRRLVPDARVGVAHGEMAGETLERVMVDFVRRQLQVLVSTAIIESGLDIPSANTMIVNRADMFGLAQLYQLRGRIGRGRERAFAYLLLPRGEQVTGPAAERLAILKRFSELGSGFSIATHDLDMRGAGDLLGAEQSGHVAAVGFELYTELLSEAVEQLKGTKHAPAIEPEIKLPIAAVLPESYVPEPVQRLAYYQRLSQASSDEAIFNIIGEIRDIYGESPEEVECLGEVMVIRRRLMALGALALSADQVERDIRIAIAFGPDATVDRDDLALRLQREPHTYRLLPSGRLQIRTVAPPEGLPARWFLRNVRETIGTLRKQGPVLLTNRVVTVP
jgi:transcription-repair coupling factor (superfamily II helicase)